MHSTQKKKEFIETYDCKLFDVSSHQKKTIWEMGRNSAAETIIQMSRMGKNTDTEFAPKIKINLIRPKKE